MFESANASTAVNRVSVILDTEQIWLLPTREVRGRDGDVGFLDAFGSLSDGSENATTFAMKQLKTAGESTANGEAVGNLAEAVLTAGTAPSAVIRSSDALPTGGRPTGAVSAGGGIGQHDRDGSLRDIAFSGLPGQSAAEQQAPISATAAQDMPLTVSMQGDAPTYDGVSHIMQSAAVASQHSDQRDGALVGTDTSNEVSTMSERQDRLKERAPQNDGSANPGLADDREGPLVPDQAGSVLADMQVTSSAAGVERRDNVASSSKDEPLTLHSTQLNARAQILRDRISPQEIAQWSNPVSAALEAADLFDAPPSVAPLDQMASTDKTSGPGLLDKPAAAAAGAGIPAPIVQGLSILTFASSSQIEHVIQAGLASESGFARPADAVLATASQAIPPPTLERSMIVHIAQSTPQPGQPSVEVTLNPEELGRVKLSIVATEGVLTVTLNAERSETMDLLRRHANELAQEYQELGYDRIDFQFQQKDGNPQQFDGRDACEIVAFERADDENATHPEPVRLNQTGVDIRV